MAEIRIQRKSRPANWPWLLLIVAAGGYVTYLGRRTVVEARADIPVEAPVMPRELITARDTVRPPDPVDEFLAFVGEPDTARVDEAQHEYTATGLRMLADAIGTLGGADAPSMTRALDNLRKRADGLRTHRKQSNAQDADRVRTAFVSAADIIETVQRAAYPNAAAAVANVRRAAAIVHSGRTLADQSATIQNFFATARDVLRVMRPTSGLSTADGARNG